MIIFAGLRRAGKQMSLRLLSCFDFVEATQWVPSTVPYGMSWTCKYEICIYIYVQEVLMILYTILHNVYYIIYIVSDIHMILLQSQVLWGSLSQSDPTLLNANTWHQRQHHQERKVWSLGKATATINGGTVPNSWMVNEKSQTNSWMIFGYPHGLETSTLKV